MARIVIVMEGGLVQDIFSDEKGTEIIVCDYDDTEDEDDTADVIETPFGDSGFHQKRDAEYQTGLVEAWFSRWGKHELEMEKKGVK